VDRKVGRVGLISIAVQATGRWYFDEVLRGAEARVAAAGHTALVHSIPVSDTSTASAVAAVEQDFSGRDSLGAVIGGFKYRAADGTKALAWRRPIVTVGGSVLGFPTVMIDDIGAARQATSHLIGLGHTRIAHITEPLQNQADFLVFGRRVKGYVSAVQSAGLDADVIEMEREFDADSARRIAGELLRRASRPTGVFAASDEVAFAVLAAARDLHLVPGRDVSVIGFDDQPEAAVQGLTTMRQQPAEMGATAVDMLLSGLSAGPDPKQSRLHPVTLVARGSTGPAPTA
jgi:LacI family repressor for deo operon, udp, cdd, tsx, nupC, and nupG